MFGHRWIRTNLTNFMPDDTTSILEKLPLPKPDIYFEASKNRYWETDARGRWIQLVKDDVLLSLSNMGYKARAAKGADYSMAHQELGRIRKEQNIVYAGAVAGLRPGLQRDGVHQYLVTTGPDLIEPKEGSWENIKKLGTRLVGEEQFEYILGWSKNAVVSLYSETQKPGQMLVLAGPKGCGKSFWQTNIITPLLGSRVARPIQYMSGQTTFNEDIIQSEHLMLDDEVSKTDVTSRRAFGAAIKNFTVSTTQRLHGKGRDAFVVKSSHWMSLSVNDEPENLSILPPMDDSIADKIILLKCQEAINTEWPGIENTQRDFQPIIAAELPAFIHYLINEHEVKAEVYDLRFGIKAYHNPELASRLNNLSPEAELENLIDVCFAQAKKEKGTIKMTSNEIQNALENNPETGRRAQRLLSYYTATGHYLGRLAIKKPEKFGNPNQYDRTRYWNVTWKHE